MDEKTLKELIENEGADFYDTEVVSENGNNIYRIYITCKDGVNLDLCAKISNVISPILDLNPPIKGQYFLEVSSPGIERKLKKPRHFMGSIGEEIKVQLVNTDKIKGTLKNADEKSIRVEEDDQMLEIFYDDIFKAKTYVQW